MPHPLFHAKNQSGTVTVCGLPRCFLGHRVGERDGIFAGWEWNGNQLRVYNDRYGFYPLFYFATPDEIAISPSIPQLVSLGAPLEIDHDALAIYLRLGFMLGEDTPFRSIRALPPDTRFTWSPGQLEVSGQLAISRQHDLNRNDAVEGYITFFREAIRKRVPAGREFCVPLSGGRDSRHILFELYSQGFRPRFTITMEPFPARSHEDIRIAAEVCRTLGIPHVVRPQPDTRFETELHKNWKTSFCTDEHQWALAMAAYLRGKVECLYHGVAGDTLTESVFSTQEHVNLFAKGDFEALASTLLRLPDNGLLRKMLRPEAYRRVNPERAIARLSAELRRHAQAPNPIGSFYLWNKGRREVTLIPNCLWRDIGTTYSPYLDHDLFDFLSALPARSIIGTGLHTEVIHKAYPQYAHLPFEDEAAPRRPNHSFYRRFARKTLQYVGLHRSAWLRNTYLIPRLMRCLADSSYSGSISWLAPTAIYLLQLEELVRTKGSQPNPRSLRLEETP
ncbi:MAG: asparagine synthase-related protein [Terriglobales bacterium]